MEYKTTRNGVEMNIAIIGAGPAGLMAAETLAQAGARVTVYDARLSPGRKFLRAGVGGLNLTHSEPLDVFLARYRPAAPLEPILRAFGPQQMVAWARGLGFETFVGTSGRVFPLGMKASPLLRAWLRRLDALGVVFQFGYRWAGFARQDGTLIRFQTPDGLKIIAADAVILALGGGSWPKLGATGGWVTLLEAQGAPIAPLKPANCGFDVAWSEVFKTKFDGAPLKAVAVKFGELCKQGEFIITCEGVEGSLIYALAADLRDEIDAQGSAQLFLDLAPGWNVEKLIQRLAAPRGSRSLSHYLEKAVGLKGVKAGLLWEFVPRKDFASPEKLAAAIKSLPVPLIRPRPLAEAISSAGGVRFDGLDETLMLKALPGVFCAGEMLDWEAPTGGYLLTGCMSTGKWAAEGLIRWLNR